MYKVSVEGLGSNRGTFGWRIERDQLGTFITVLVDNGWESITISPVEEVDDE